MKTKKTAKRLLALVMCLVMCCFAVPSVQAAEKTEEKWLSFSELVQQKGYVNGLQQPYFVKSSTGNCWGKSWMDGYKKTIYDEEMFKEFFYDTKAMGFDIAQLWLSYNLAGMVFDENRNVIGVDQTYIENLPKVLQIAKDVGLYVSLVTISHFEGAMSNDTSSFRYEQVSQFIHDETARQMLFENWLKPILNVIKDFPNVVVLNLYCEPEADGGKWSLPNGTNWNEMRGFIKAQNEFVKSILPNIETYSAATGEAADIYENYKDLGLDYYGYDYYTKSGGTNSLEELYLNAPLVYGEIGVLEGTPGSNNEEFQQNWAVNYLEEAVFNGAKAGFYWSYGWGNGGGQSMTEEKSRPRGASVTYRFWQLDRDYAIAGIECDLDKPAMAYSTDYSVVFLGSRGAEKYRIERTKDLKNWTEIETFNPEEVMDYEYQPFCFEYNDVTAVPGNSYYYRVVAVNSEGKEVASDPSNIVHVKQIVCADEDNLVGNGGFEDEDGFSTSGTNGKWYLEFQHSNNAELLELIKGEYIKDGVAGEETNTGTHSIYKLARLRQKVTLKPNTNYTFTFYYRFTNKDGYWANFVGLSVGIPSGHYDLFDDEYCKLIDYIQMQDTTKDGAWHRKTVYFNSGDITECYVDFQGYRTRENNAEWYVDDVYLFESK